MKIAALFSILTIISAAASAPAGKTNGCSKADSCAKGEQFPCDLKTKSCGGPGTFKWNDNDFRFEPNRTELLHLRNSSVLVLLSGRKSIFTSWVLMSTPVPLMDSRIWAH